MSSGGSYGRAAASSSRSFDFGSDDVLCSYDDFAAQDPSMGKRSDPPGKDLHESRLGRPLVSIYEQEDHSREGILSSVDRCMKKHADNLLRSLDGISGYLSQLEITCYKLERSLGELRADFIQNQNDKDMKFKSLEKNLQEVHRSVQILRDKQELSETQNELAKLQMAKKEPAENNVNAVKSSNDKLDTVNKQLVLAQSCQGATVVPVGTSQPMQPYKELPLQNQATLSPNIQHDQIIMNQAGNYYAPHQTPPHDQRGQPVHSELRYMQPRPQIQDRPIQAPQQQPQFVNQNQPPFPQYQQQLPPQPEHQPLPQPSPSQAQIRPQPPQSYPPYPSQSVNPGPETYPSSLSMQAPNPSIPQTGGVRSELVPYAYGGPGGSGSVQQPSLHQTMQQPSQPLVSQGSFGPQPSKGGYMGSAPYPSPQNLHGYNAAYNYTPSNHPAAKNQQMPPGNSGPLHYDTQMNRNLPYGEMIEKAVGMGFDKNQVINVIQRMVESGQPMNFNSLLDRLNGQAGGASARAW